MLRFSNEWLRDKIASDPDVECEAGPSLEKIPMTTTVKIHVNGKYRATVTLKAANGDVVETAVVEGNYEGSPNPSGERSFGLYHPAIATFDIIEEQVTDGHKPA